MMSGKEGTIRVEWKYADDFKRVYVTNSFGVAGDYDYKLLFGATNVLMQEDPTTMPKALGQFKVEVSLPFRTLKELRNALDDAVKVVETRFGEIKLPKQPEDYFKQP
jgi:hypothetical protein